MKIKILDHFTALKGLTKGSECVFTNHDASKKLLNEWVDDLCVASSYPNNLPSIKQRISNIFLSTKKDSKFICRWVLSVDSSNARSQYSLALFIILIKFHMTSYCNNNKMTSWLYFQFKLPIWSVARVPFYIIVWAGSFLYFTGCSDIRKIIRKT